MTRTEVELLSSIALIYLSDCVYWLTPDQQAFIRITSNDWKSHRINGQSFTLLKRMPVLSDPLLFLPGFIRYSEAASPSNRPTSGLLRKISKRLNRLWIVEVQCRVQGILLLVFLPWIVYSGRLSQLWLNYIVALLLSHLLLLSSFYQALKRNDLPIKSILPLAINPLGAIRLLDIFTQLLFNQLSHQLQRAD